jgi:hypothetical protein
VDVDELLEDVATQVGLDDYGDPTFRDGLEPLWWSGMHEADLTEIGMLAFEGQIRMNLTNRLRVLDWHRTHPELAATKVEAPLILVGMPRSGTTALSHLLAADPDNRSLLAWEATDSIPPPTTETYQTDPRFEAARSTVSPTELLNPEFKAIHHDEPDDAMECTVLHAQHFQSLIYSTVFNLPAYDEWLLPSKWHGAVRYHEQVLQVLQSECPGRWQLKSPQYGLLLDELFERAAGKPHLGYTLEGRVSNSRAIQLYRRKGFLDHGIRPGYYSDNGEDAMIMWRSGGPEAA